MKWFVDLKIKNKISLVFLFVVVIEGILFSLVYKGIENITSIKELQSNMITGLLISVAITIVLGLILTNLICKPIKKLNNIARSIVNGDLNENIDIKTEDEIGELADSFKIILKNINNLVDDSNDIEKSIEKGNFNINLDKSKYNGTWKSISENCIATSNIFIKNIKTTSDYIEKISKGEISTKYSQDEAGEFNVVKNNINQLIDNLRIFEDDIQWFKGTFKEGNTRDKMDVSKYQGVYKEMAECINDTTWVSIDVFIKMFAVLKSYSEGDFSVELEKLPGRYGIANESLDNLRINIIKVSDEQIRILTAASEGNLHIRGEAEQFTGSFKELVNNVNKAIDAFAKPIREINNALGEMAKGNLDIDVENSYSGDYASIINSLNSSVQAINQVLTDINASANDVASGSSQVSDGSQALSQGATEQASAIEQLTSSITEVAAQTKENAVNANQAKDLALKVKENAEEGNRHMSEMLKSMGEINESSTNISKIIKVIDEIAFQTNILALNAAVEAARAGQHGKGFAVVAEEVRNLAARSANAAKETTDLIEGSIKKAEKGTDIANNTAKALYEIVDGVSKAATLVAEIAASSNEQATGISQINLGIEQVSQVVQTNSATAEESAAASEELSSQSELLKEMISSFKLKNSNFKGSNSLNNGTKNKQHYVKENDKALKEVAATSSKNRISLSDSEFGKY